VSARGRHPAAPAERGSRWLAFALALTTATQLRIPGLPVGAGELLLLGWILAEVLRMMFQGRVAGTPLARTLPLLWLALWGVLALGWLNAYRLDVRGASAGHDFPAFVFAGLLVVALVARPGAEARLRASVEAVATATVVPLALLLLAIPVTTQVGPVVIWAGRFHGWALNPNQIAIALAPVPFLMLHRLHGGTPHRRRVALVAAGSVAVGVASLSDALFLGWAIAGALSAAMVFVAALRRPQRSFGRAALLYVLVPITLLLGAGAVGVTIVRRVDTIIASVYHGDREQGALRVQLWRHGLEAISESPVVGLGPGAHSGVLAPHQGSESHNSLIDWTASTGLVGMSLLGALLLWAVARAAATGSAGLVGAIVAMLTLSLFHYTLRQPLFWFYLLYVTTEAAAIASRARIRRAPASGRPIAAMPGT
jgi:O-antigen ligase